MSSAGVSSGSSIDSTTNSHVWWLYLSLCVQGGASASLRTSDVAVDSGGDVVVVSSSGLVAAANWIIQQRIISDLPVR